MLKMMTTCSALITGLDNRNSFEVLLDVLTFSPEFIGWALQPPGWIKEWHTGVRVAKSNKLVGFISAVPAHIRMYEKYKHMVEINFLCVHKKLRSKRLAPVLIREITRRVNIQGIFQAVYTAGVVLPKPVGTCRCSR